ncbi:EF-P beta-lysylation protein EpmB [Gammaproteobacteria bacterium]|nr:EF-P beta-lysylation protein EpmB [Gammaproteobacteria bacterium]
MIPSNSLPWQAKTWQTQLSGAVTQAEDLAQILGLSLNGEDWDTDPTFPMRVPMPYISRMRHGDRRDPLLCQVIPQLAERIDAVGFKSDPLLEASAAPVPGLIQKYQGRVLVIAAEHCAVNCRYCFRRDFSYAQHRHDTTFPMLDYVRDDASIHEVILSGGDPLIMPDERLNKLVASIEAIPHVKRLRIHTRLPVVIPQRVSQPLIEMLVDTRLSTVIVAHFNHANEIDKDVAIAFAALRRAGITLLNQSVLLAGVNDDDVALCDLSEALFEVGILPYYLHLPDRVRGTSHFHVDIDTAIRLHTAIQSTLPGYLVPKLVQEIPGRPAKELIATDSLPVISTRIDPFA